MTDSSNLRLRAVHSLDEPDGSCGLLYDLERTLIFQVPAGLRADIGWEIRSARFGDATRSWLIEEDLLTRQEAVSWTQGDEPAVPQVTDVSLDMSGACNMGCSYCFEKDIHSRIGRMDEATAMAALDFAFRKARGAARVALHFGSGEPLLRFDLLRKIVAEAMRRADDAGQEIVFDLTTNATLATPEIAGFLSEHPFRVRVSCDGPPEIHDRFRPMIRGGGSYAAVERGLKRLLEALPDRVTVNSVIAGDTRLATVWEWAKELSLLHYHVIKVGAFAEDDLTLPEAGLEHFRTDLEAVCDDLFADLEAGRRPIDYQPITKVVRRLMIPEPVTRFCGVAGSYLGVASNGKVYPCFRHLGLSRYELGDVWGDVDDGRRQQFLGQEAADVDSRPVCRECWARYLCGGGCYADSTVYGPDKLKPQVQHCPFWRAEIAQAIRFYDRLLERDPVFCLRLFGDDPDAILGSVGGIGFLERRNCL